jgi:hypothetical protein
MTMWGRALGNIMIMIYHYRNGKRQNAVFPNLAASGRLQFD